MVGADQLFTRHLVEPCGQPLGQPSRVDKNDGRSVLADQLQDPRMDRWPDAPAGALVQGADHGCGAAEGVGASLQVGHVLDWHLDRDLHRLDPARIDDFHLTPGSTQKQCSLGQRPLRR